MKFDLAQSQLNSKTHIDYFYVFFITALHVGAVAAFFFFSWTNLLAFFLLYVMGGAGITIGYHRLLTHKSFVCPRWLEYFWATLGASAIQGGPITWVAQHRQHHQKSDTDLDPHNIHVGFMYAHMWWIFNRYPPAHEEGQRQTFAPDLLKHSYYRWLEKYAYMPAVVLGAALFYFGGWGLFLWGFCLRSVCIYHSTWLVNSAAHKWGYRYFKDELATNNWWVAIVALGEGWHNNHHAFPNSARHGLRGWEFDFSWISIWMMKKLGLATKIKVPAKEELPWYKEKIKIEKPLIQ